MSAKVESGSKLEKLLGDSEFNRFGLIAAILIIVGCLGGAAVGLGAVNNTFTLILVTIPTMSALTLVMAVSPMRWIINVTAVAVVIDVLMILYFTLFT